MKQRSTYYRDVKRITEKSICLKRGTMFVKIDCELENDGSLEELEWQFYSDSKCKKEVKVDGIKKVKAKPFTAVKDGCSPHPFIEGRYTNFQYREPASLWFQLLICLSFCCCICIFYFVKEMFKKEGD